MKLVRYGRVGKEKPGLVDGDGKLRDLSGKIGDITPDMLSPKGLKKLSRYNPKRLPLVRGRPRLGVPWTPVARWALQGYHIVSIMSKHNSRVLNSVRGR